MIVYDLDSSLIGKCVFVNSKVNRAIFDDDIIIQLL